MAIGYTWPTLSPSRYLQGAKQGRGSWLLVAATQPTRHILYFYP